MKVLLASNSSNSINKSIVDYLINKGYDLTYIDLLKENVPMYSADEEIKNSIPKYIENIFEQIQETDEDILIVTPEYNGNNTPFFLNIISWLSRIDKHIFKDKRVKVICVTPGKMGGKSVRNILENSLPFFGSSTVSTFGLANYYEIFKNNEFTNKKVKQELLSFLNFQ